MFGAQLFAHLSHLLFAEQRQPLRTSFSEGFLAFLPALLQLLLLLQAVGVGFMQQRKAFFEQRQLLLRLLLLRLQSGERVFRLLYRLRRLFMLLQRLLPAPLFVVAAVQPGAELLAIRQRKVERQRCAELPPLLLLGSQLLFILRDGLLLALLLFLQAFAAGTQLGALGLQFLGEGTHLDQTLFRGRRLHRLILLYRRMAGGTAQRAGGTVLQQGALRLQTDDAFFQFVDPLHFLQLRLVLFELLTRVLQLLLQPGELRLPLGMLRLLPGQTLASLTVKGCQSKQLLARWAQVCQGAQALAQRGQRRFRLQCLLLLLLNGQRFAQRAQLLLMLCGLRRQLVALDGELLQRGLLFSALLRGGIAGLSPLGLGR